MIHRFLVLFTHLIFLSDTAPIEKTLCRCEKFAFGGKPFVALWNSPTIGCDFNFSIPIHLKKYGILENDRQTWDGRQVTLFSAAQLGLYPYFVMNGDQNFNGGLPQLVDLNEHLRKARLDILNKIPDPDFNGVAVIDWEPWRPLWETNWNKKRIYKVRSVELVRSKHPDWPLDRLIKQAKQEFEDAGRAMFEHTITLGKQLRPKALWGFYGFPDCFAHVKNRYQCTPEVMKQNDKLEWLFSSSTALFPSMYLLDQHPDNQDYVLGRLRETLRFSTRGVGQNKKKVPIFVYHRNIYENSPHDFNFLTKTDLDNTIGSAADIGASGIIIWGNRFDENTSPEVCRRIDSYVANTLGPYLQHKTKEVESCISHHCNNNGHCVRRDLLNNGLNKIFTEQIKDEQCTVSNQTVITSPKDEVRIQHENTQTRRMNHTIRNNDNTQTRNGKMHGYSFDLGTELAEGHYVNHSAMDDFFQQLGTNKPTNKKTTRRQNRNSTSNSQLKKTYRDEKMIHLGSLNEETVRTNTSKVGIHTKLDKTHTKDVQVKKSDIPHPFGQQNIVMDQTRSEIVHRLLSSVQGNLISSKELLRKHNETRKSDKLSSRKSEIVKATGPHTPIMASVRKNQRSWMPHIYVILIGVSLGGALLFSLIFVAVYYYISLQNTFTKKKKEGSLDLNESSKSLPPQAHSSPKFNENESFKEKLNSEADGESMPKKKSSKKTPATSHETHDDASERRSRRVRSVERRASSDHDRDRRTRSHSESRAKHHRGKSSDNRRSMDESRDRRNHTHPERQPSNDARKHKSRKDRHGRYSRDEYEEEINFKDLR